jgi:hypothetical protein
MMKGTVRENRVKHEHNVSICFIYIFMARALGVSTLEHQVTHDLQALNAPPSRCAAAMLLMVCASANADLYTYIDESGVT